MFKKFLNAILFGALILGSAGTITSCKDYDDEIDEINQKLNTLSSKDELAAQVSSLTSTISAAQSAAAQASTEAANALTAAKEAAAQAEQAATGAGQATGQAAEAINNAKAAATAADAAAKTAADAAAKAKAASEDAAKAVAAGADATKAIAEAKAAAEAAQKAAADAKAGVEAAQKAAAEAAKSAVADAQKEIAEAAKKVAEEAAKEAAAAASKAELAELAKRIEALEKGEDVKKIAEEVEAAKKKVDAIIGKISAAVTSVSLVDSYTAAQMISSLDAFKPGQGTYANIFWEDVYFYDKQAAFEEAEYTEDGLPPFGKPELWDIGDNPLDLEFTTVFEAADITVAQGWGLWKTEFNTDPKKETGNFTGLGKDLKDAITFVKDRQVNRPAVFVVRVSPTNAVLTKDMIQFVNSNGETMDAIIEVKDVLKFEGTLTRPDGATYVETRAEQETGLWFVKVALKEFDPETFYPLTQILTDLPEGYEAKTRASINQEDDNPAAGQYGYDAKLVNKILYAVQVNNTAEDAADRYVTSSYDLTFDWAKYQRANRLHYSVGGKRVENWNNRFDINSQSFFTDNNGTLESLMYGERAWLPNKVDVKPNINLGNVAATAKKQNADLAANISLDKDYYYGYEENDNRSGKPMLNVVPGETFTVTLDEYQGWAWDDGRQGYGIDPVLTASAVRAMYIVLDQPTAIESEPSEWQAWQTYQYTGINQVVEGTSIDLTVDGEGLLSENGDIIGFRVYGINWDGTLVDPDGRAFYVQVGGGKAAAAGDTEVTPQNEKVIPSNRVKFENLSASAQKANHFVWRADIIPYLNSTDQDADEAVESIAFYPVFANVDEKGTKTDIQVFNTSVTTDEEGNLIIEGDITGDLSKVNQLYTVPMINNWLAYIDFKTYKGTLTLQDKSDKITRDLATIDISFTKKLPQGVPAGFAVKENQIVNGVYVAYLTPSDASGADKWAVPANDNKETLEKIYGTRHMLDFLNLGTSKSDVTSLAKNYEFTFTTSKVGVDWATGDPALVTNFIAKGNDDPILVVPAYFYDKNDKKSEVIDGKTKHASKVEYNYGKISTREYWEKPDGTSGYNDYKQTAIEFETIFSDIYDNNIHTWDWVTLDQLKNEILKEKNPATIKATEWADKVKADKAAGKVTVKDLPEDYIKSVIYGEESFELNTDYFLGTNAFDGIFTALLSNSYNNSLEVVSATLTTTSTGYEEYYKFDSYSGGMIKFVRKSNSTNPVADVPSTLTITVKDSYGHKYHKVVINGFNVLKR